MTMPGICSVCTSEVFLEDFVTFSQCGHRFCKSCVQTHFVTVIRSGRSNMTCLMCSSTATEPEVMASLEPDMYQKYIDYTFRRYIAQQSSNVRQCIAPDCPFLYILENPSSCADNHFVCQNQGCGIEFCYICKSQWHEGMNCSKARSVFPDSKLEKFVPQETLTKEEMESLNIKLCPRCSTVAEKIDDGGCNHVHCNVCNLEFCWLCLRPSSELHYLSPTGCPMYGRRRWSWWKTWIFRFFLWMTAPIILLLLAIIIFFFCLIAIPILVGYLACTAGIIERKKLYIRIIVTFIAVAIAIVLSPLVSLLIAIIIIPLGLCYAYVFVPIHLLRTYTGRIPDAATQIV